MTRSQRPGRIVDRGSSCVAQSSGARSCNAIERARSNAAGFGHAVNLTHVAQGKQKPPGVITGGFGQGVASTLLGGSYPLPFPLLFLHFCLSRLLPPTWQSGSSTGTIPGGGGPTGAVFSV